MKNKSDNLKRVIVDFKKLTPEILALLVEKYPDGYDDDDIITFDNHKNETIEAVQVETLDTIYLVKIGSKLRYSMVNYESLEDHDEQDTADAKELDLDESEEE